MHCKASEQSSDLTGLAAGVSSIRGLNNHWEDSNLSPTIRSLDNLDLKSFCQERADLLKRWSDTSQKFSRAVLEGCNGEEIERLRRANIDAHKAFDDHARIHGCREGGADQ